MRSRISLIGTLILCALATAGAHVSFAEPLVMHATGTFDVDLTPQPPDDEHATAAGVSRLAIRKTFHGALEGTSHGQMLASGDGATSGAYVAIEKITGTLDGRRGSFALVHRASMRGGAPDGWSIATVPDSGTGELVGIDATMTITIANGVHSYDLSYTLPDASGR